MAKAKSLLTPPAFVCFIHLPCASQSHATNHGWRPLLFILHFSIGRFYRFFDFFFIIVNFRPQSAQLYLSHVHCAVASGSFVRFHSLRRFYGSESHVPNANKCQTARTCGLWTRNVCFLCREHDVRWSMACFDAFSRLIRIGKIVRWILLTMSISFKIVLSLCEFS